MFSNIVVKDLIPIIENNQMVLIDVRSPSEFKEFTIPGSINIPFFTDEERAEIGTLYKQISVDAAMERGLEIISAKLPQFIRSFKEIEGDKVVFCWRGGMRSRTTATLLDLMHIHVHRLDGGIRAYRNWVVQELEHYQITSKAYFLNGLTGTGKTKILKDLQSQGYPVIDLEGLAGHKGSIFGHVGQNPRNQKSFDALLIHHLRKWKKAPFILFEAESSRIGKVALPPFLKELKEKSTHFIIQMPIDERIKIILEDYHPAQFQQDCMDAFLRIKNRIHTPIAKQIEEDIQNGHFHSAVQLLLEFYYDSRYQHSGLQYADSQKQTIKVMNVEEAIESIKEIIPEMKTQEI